LADDAPWFQWRVTLADLLGAAGGVGAAAAFAVRRWYKHHPVQCRYIDDAGPHRRIVLPVGLHDIRLRFTARDSRTLRSFTVRVSSWHWLGIEGDVSGVTLDVPRVGWVVRGNPCAIPVARRSANVDGAIEYRVQGLQGPWHWPKGAHFTIIAILSVAEAPRAVTLETVFESPGAHPWLARIPLTVR
jgi:hypothetical protein